MDIKTSNEHKKITQWFTYLPTVVQLVQWDYFESASSVMDTPAKRKEASEMIDKMEVLFKSDKFLKAVKIFEALKGELSFCENEDGVMEAVSTKIKGPGHTSFLNRFIDTGAFVTPFGEIGVAIQLKLMKGTFILTF